MEEGIAQQKRSFLLSSFWDDAERKWKPLELAEWMRHLMGPSSRDARSLRPPGEDEIAGQARKDTEGEHVDVWAGGKDGQDV